MIKQLLDKFNPTRISDLPWGRSGSPRRTGEDRVGAGAHPGLSSEQHVYGTTAMSIIHSRFVRDKVGCITSTHVNEAPAIAILNWL